MITVVLVIHLLIATALVGVILIQRSEGGALGGLGGGTFGGLMSARGSANLLTRTTAILAGCFMCTSVVLALLASQGRGGGSILDAAPRRRPPRRRPRQHPSSRRRPLLPRGSPPAPVAR
jgi:preprotein translocase subunit SecG